MSDEPNKTSDVYDVFKKDDRTYFSRFLDMCKNLSKPHDSIEYKEAIRELQRQWAPIAAVAIPLLACVIMCSIQIGNPNAKPPEVEVEVIEPEPAEQLDEPEPPPPEEIMETTEDLVDSFISDTPSPPIGEVTAPTPTENPPLQSNASAPKMAGIPSRGSGGGGLGGGNRLESDMLGMFIDLSHDGNGNTRSYGNNKAELYSAVKYMLDKNLGREAFTPYQIIPKRIPLARLIVKSSYSAVGPKSFGVQDKVKKNAPWVVVYRGKLQPEKSGTYRFAGYFDDVMVVRVGGKTVMEYYWDTRNNKAGEQSKLKTGWTTPNDPIVGKHVMKTNGGSTPLAYSSWIDLNANQSVDIEILIGDDGGEGDSGGSTGGILLIEERGRKYDKTKGGMPILTPFSTTRLTYAERENLNSDLLDASGEVKTKYPFSMKDIPTMNTCGKKSASVKTKDDVEVDTGDL